jgi:hypothetical protein
VTDLLPSSGGPAGPAGCGAAIIVFVLTLLVMGVAALGIWWIMRSAEQMTR